MSTIPEIARDRMQFYQNHLAPWTSFAVEIGSTVAEVADLAIKLQAAQDAFNAQQVAKDAAKNATETYRVAYEALSTLGAGIVKQIRAKAETSGDPNIYTLAVLSPPAPPTPKGAPGKPTDLAVTLKGDGAIELSWKCKNPRGTTGTMYQVWRRFGDTGEFSYLGGVGARKFLDTTVLHATTAVTYKIQAVRSTLVGDWGTFTVFLGTDTGGTPMVTGVTTAPKLAA